MQCGAGWPQWQRATNRDITMSLLFLLLLSSAQSDVTEEKISTAESHSKETARNIYFPSQRQGVTLMIVPFHTLAVILTVTGCGALFIKLTIPHFISDTPVLWCFTTAPLKAVLECSKYRANFNGSHADKRDT